MLSFILFLCSSMHAFIQVLNGFSIIASQGWRLTLTYQIPGVISS